MDRLKVFFNTVLLFDDVLTNRSVEIGARPHCDVLVPGGLGGFAGFLIRGQLDGPVVFDLGSAMTKPTPLPYSRETALNGCLSVLITTDDVTPAEPKTSPLNLGSSGSLEYEIRVGQSSSARALRVGPTPQTIGSGSHCSLVVHDETVSGEHLRCEWTQQGLMVRDLGSRNGTWVSGHKVSRVFVGPGSHLRIGRTDLFVHAVSDDVDSDGPVALSASFKSTLAEARWAAGTNLPILILGPSGVGKEEVARFVHRNSSRNKGPFVAVNAGGFPAELLESELFGHEKGAFTGAESKRRGCFELASGGTLFIDEIGELPMVAQARLLRVLETWEVRRVGGESAFKVDLRLITATHRELRAMVTRGTFREDLYYRLAQYVIDVPPLCQRPEDVEALAAHFLRKVPGGSSSGRITSDARNTLLRYAWPGNARELRNVITFAALRSGGQIDSSDIEQALDRLGCGEQRSSDQNLQYLVNNLGGNISEAARVLGMPRETLRDKLKTTSGDSSSRTRRTSVRPIGAM